MQACVIRAAPSVLRQTLQEGLVGGSRKETLGFHCRPPGKASSILGFLRGLPAHVLGPQEGAPRPQKPPQSVKQGPS